MKQTDGISQKNSALSAPADAAAEQAAQASLSRAAAELTEAVDGLEKELEQTYQEIAQSAGGADEREGLERTVQASLDCLRRNKSSIFSTYQRTSAM